MFEQILSECLLNCLSVWERESRGWSGNDLPGKGRKERWEVSPRNAACLAESTILLYLAVCTVARTSLCSATPLGGDTPWTYSNSPVTVVLRGACVLWSLQRHWWVFALSTPFPFGFCSLVLLVSDVEQGGNRRDDYTWPLQRKIKALCTLSCFSLVQLNTPQHHDSIANMHSTVFPLLLWFRVFFFFQLSSHAAHWYPWRSIYSRQLLLAVFCQRMYLTELHPGEKQKGKAANLSLCSFSHYTLMASSWYTVVPLQSNPRGNLPLAFITDKQP